MRKTTGLHAGFGADEGKVTSVVTGGDCRAFLFLRGLALSDSFSLCCEAITERFAACDCFEGLSCAVRFIDEDEVDEGIVAAGG